MDNKMIIGAILVNYCGFDDTIDAIKSLKGGTLKPNVIIIIDNASPDDSGNKLIQFYRNDEIIHVILSTDNIGFGAANNTAANEAARLGCTHLLIINNDTVVDSGMLFLLRSEWKTHTVCLPLMLYYSKPDIVWYGGGEFDFWGIPRHILQGDSIKSINYDYKYVDFATGCCFFISLQDYFSVDGFDEAYFLYWEDVDISLKFKEAGIKMKIISKAKLYHKVSASTGGENSPTSFYYGTRNRFYGIRKFRLGIRPVIWSSIGAVRAIICQKPVYQFAYAAVYDAIHGVTGSMPTKWLRNRG